MIADTVYIGETVYTMSAGEGANYCINPISSFTEDTSFKLRALSRRNLCLWSAPGIKSWPNQVVFIIKFNLNA